MVAILSRVPLPVPIHDLEQSHHLWCSDLPVIAFHPALHSDSLKGKYYQEA